MGPKKSKMAVIAILLAILSLLLPQGAAIAAEANIPLEHAQIDPRDQASLQRGAKFFVNYCMGCHSLAYMRYNRMASDIGITDKEGKVLEQLVKDNLIFTDDKITNTMQIAMRKSDAIRWFGTAPPDLSLIVKVRGADWVYTYLQRFYKDDTRPWGSNNLLFPDVAMPNVLSGLQGILVPLYRRGTVKIDSQLQQTKVIDSLALSVPGVMTPPEFDAAITDLVNFLAYVGDPNLLPRHRLGKWVLLFLAVFAGLTFLLKKEYWKDINK